MVQGEKKERAATEILISSKSESSILDKFKKLQIHRRHRQIEAIAAEMTPMLQSIINYDRKFS